MEIIESLSKKEHFKGRGKFSKIYDLKENYLLPGFVDAHMHFSALVALFSAISLRECRSIEEMKERLKKDESDFVIGWGFDHELFKEKGYQQEKIIGIDKNTEDPEGGI
jgi:Predicted metal-dependent hydrolase with the TIM-barrel fold